MGLDWKKAKTANFSFQQHFEKERKHEILGKLENHALKLKEFGVSRQGKRQTGAGGN